METLLLLEGGSGAFLSEWEILDDYNLPYQIVNYDVTSSKKSERNFS